MTLFDTSTLAHDADFRERIAAAAAGEGITDPHPLTWADLHQWQLAADPGMSAAYAYAVAIGKENPGRAPDVITDAALIDAVRGILAPPPEAPGDGDAVG